MYNVRKSGYESDGLSIRQQPHIFADSQQITAKGLSAQLLTLSPR